MNERSTNLKRLLDGIRRVEPEAGWDQAPDEPIRRYLHGMERGEAVALHTTDGMKPDAIYGDDWKHTAIFDLDDGGQRVGP